MKKIFIISTILGIGVSLFSQGNDIAGIEKIGDLTWQKCSAGQDPVTCSGTAVGKKWADAISYCSSVRMAGKTSRLPTKDELKSLVVPGTAPTINKVLFPNTPSSYYWSSSTVDGNTTGAWRVYFRDGRVYSAAKSSSFSVRCVSGP